MNTYLLCTLLLAVVALASAAEPLGRPFEVKIKSSVDGTEQSALALVPEGYDGQKPTPLLVGLHTWSGQYKQQARAMGPRANKRGWLLVLPNFRGPNVPQNPDARLACASITAQRDVMDAVQFMRERYNVDAARIYLMGASGGGHMAQMMAGKYPDVWAGVSAWVGISDLRLWQAENKGYAAGVHKCIGGKPGDSVEVDWQYLSRSPVTFIQNASNTRLDIQHGEHDTSVPFHHSVDSYNLVSQVPGHQARLTVFDGGHEIKYGQAFDWLSKLRRSPEPPKVLWLTTDEEKSYYYAHLTPAARMKLGKCKIQIADGPKLVVEMEGLKELRIDAAQAGLAGQEVRVEYRTDGQAQAIVVGAARVGVAGKRQGEATLKP